MTAAFRSAGAIAASAATSGNLAPALPAGHVANDILVLNAWVYNTGGSPPSITTPTGYTLLQTNSSGNFLHKVFWKRDNGSESAPSVPFTAGGTTTTECAVAILSAFSAAITTGDPTEGVSGAIVTTPAASITGRAITTTGADRLGVQVVAMNDNVTATINNSWDERSDVLTTTGSDAALYLATKTIATASTEGAPTITPSLSVNSGVTGFALIPVPPPPPGEIYVATTGNDTTGNGSQGNPYATIQKASTVAQPGDTVLVEDGTYTGGFATAANGSSGNPITYRSINQWGAKITNAASGTSSVTGFWENSGDFVNIEDFEVFGNDSNTSATWNFGIYSYGTNCTISGCKVHDLLRNATAFTAADAGNGSAGIEVDGFDAGVNMNLIGNLVFNQGPDASSSSTAGHALYHAGEGSIKNNVIYNVAGLGVSLWHGAISIDIINNTVDNARDGGILVGSGDSGVGPGTGDNCNVRNNIVRNCSIGILEGGQTGVNNTYQNNLTFSNTTNFSLQNGLTATGTVTSDPLHVDRTNHDYHLQGGSPAINAGTASLAPADDFDGVTRTGNPDIGAFEATGGGTVYQEPLTDAVTIADANSAKVVFATAAVDSVAFAEAGINAEHVIFPVAIVDNVNLAAADANTAHAVFTAAIIDNISFAETVSGNLPTASSVNTKHSNRSMLGVG